MVVIATRIPKDVHEKLVLVCRDVYGITAISTCLKEIVFDVIAAYNKIKPTRETLQQTLLELLRKRT